MFLLVTEKWDVKDWVIYYSNFQICTWILHSLDCTKRLPNTKFFFSFIGQVCTFFEVSCLTVFSLLILTSKIAKLQPKCQLSLCQYWEQKLVSGILQSDFFRFQGNSYYICQTNMKSVDKDRGISLFNFFPNFKIIV